MNEWQMIFVLVFAVVNLLAFIKGYRETIFKKNPVGNTMFLYPLGIFVWADGIIIGLFWVLVSITAFLLNDWILILLFYSVFWVVRSFGETIYWFNQQFSEIRRYPKEDIPLYKIIKVDDDYTMWFILQIMNQCITVISIITSIYLFHLWFK